MAYAKAIVALITPLVLLPMSYFGISPESTVEEALTVALTAVITSMLVYFTPNKQ
jgi:CDP-diglyceride synthetase